jgi:hypothetical protein
LSIGAVLIVVGALLIGDEIRDARRDRRDASFWLALDLVNFGHPYAWFGVLALCGGAWLVANVVHPSLLDRLP